MIYNHGDNRYNDLLNSVLGALLCTSCTYICMHVYSVQTYTHTYIHTHTTLNMAMTGHCPRHGTKILAQCYSSPKQQSSCPITRAFLCLFLRLSLAACKEENTVLLYPGPSYYQHIRKGLGRGYNNALQAPCQPKQCSANMWGKKHVKIWQKHNHGMKQGYPVVIIGHYILQITLEMAMVRVTNPGTQLHIRRIRQCSSTG